MKFYSSCEAIIGILLIVFTLWPNPVNGWQGWILLALGVILLIHSFMCKSCWGHNSMDMKSSKKKR